jgi:DNA-directed RNA polymerase specialized sigma24 family protein|tara:strand:+ start:706 stop:1191 length:486 start_codon:yes stop_codon:yes gene_type:complete
MNILEKAYQKHKTWINICKSFGLDEYYAEDIVQEMYIKLHDLCNVKGKNLWYNETELNYYYIFKILYTMFLQLKKKRGKVYFEDEEVLHNLESDSQFDFQEIERKFNKEFEKLHWYDQKVFEIVASGTKIAELSRKTTITYISLYNTYTKVKKILKKKMGV